jgi:O-antigen/teichoic acid export membrane protein
LVSAYFANSILPLISKLAKEDLVKLRKVYERSMMLLLIVGICAAVTTYVLAPLGIRIIAGESFNTSIILLQILSISLVVSYLNHLNGYTLIALGKQWYSFFIALVALAVNLILNIAFIPYHSYYAAAFITFITEGLIAIMSIFVIRRFVGIKFSLEIIVDFYREAFVHIRKIIKR